MLQLLFTHFKWKKWENVISFYKKQESQKCSVVFFMENVASLWKMYLRMYLENINRITVCVQCLIWTLTWIVHVGGLWLQAELERTEHRREGNHHGRAPGHGAALPVALHSFSAGPAAVWHAVLATGPPLAFLSQHCPPACCAMACI